MSKRNFSVTSHYDYVARATVSKHQRRELPTFPIRRFNNLLKRKALLSLNVRPGARILDLCCGRGGDMFKYTDVRPEHVHFIDISSESITECMRRFREASSSIQYTAKFSVADCFSDALHDVLDGYYDVVVCHFALHYAFASHETLTTTLKALHKHTRRGSQLIMTIPRYSVLRHLAHPFSDGHWKSFHGQYFSIDIEPPLRDSQSRGFGCAYAFSLDDAVDKCEEYLAPPELLYENLSLHNFRTTSSVSFIQASDDYGIADALPREDALRDVVSLYTLCIATRTDDNGRESLGSIEELREWCRTRGFHAPEYRDVPSDDYRSWVSVVSLEQPDFYMEERSAPQSTKRVARREAAGRLLHELRCPGTVIVNDVTDSVDDLLRIK